MELRITKTGGGYLGTRMRPGADPLTYRSETLPGLIKMLSEAGEHSTDIMDAVDAAGLAWPVE